MRILIKTDLALMQGFVGGWAVSLSAILRWWDLTGFHDRDGGGAMAAFFVIGPFLVRLTLRDFDHAEITGI